MIRIKAFFLFLAAAAVISGCSSDPEGPVTQAIIDGGGYDPKPGETRRFVENLTGVTVVDKPIGVGKSSLLRLGETEGLRFESILMKFNFDSLMNYEGKTVDSVLIDLPVIIVQDTLFHLKVTFNELLDDFGEDDTITATPPFSAVDIPGASGETVRDVNIERTAFSIDESIVQDWLDGLETPWPFGIVINWAAEPDTLGMIEMKSQNYGSDPPLIRVVFTDGTDALFPVIEDYNITSYKGGGVSCVGGVATRVFFEFTLDGIDEDAMIHYSAIVLQVDGENGLGATVGDRSIGFSTDFIYYLYAPDSADPSDPGFFEGTGVANRSFMPSFGEGFTQELRIPLAGYTPDVLEGSRVNTGLVFQSDLENIRFQKAAFYGITAADSLKPYIEVIYTLPADFSGGDD